MMARTSLNELCEEFEAKLNRFEGIIVDDFCIPCPNWSDAKIQIRLNTISLNRNKYFNHTNNYLFKVKYTSFNLKFQQNIQLFLKYEILKTKIPLITVLHCDTAFYDQ